MTARSAIVTPGPGYGVAATTGTMAAALGANSTIFALRNSPNSGRKIYIVRLLLDFVTVAAFTTPITAARSLTLSRGSGATPSGGTAISVAQKDDNDQGASAADSASGGDIRVATTAGLTVAGVTFEAQDGRSLPLVAQGAAGATKQFLIEDDAGYPPMVLRPGEIIAVRNVAAMDAGGTWQLTAQLDWYEDAR